VQVGRLARVELALGPGQLFLAVTVMQRPPLCQPPRRFGRSCRDLLVQSVNERVKLGDRYAYGAADVHDVDVTVVDQFVERRSSDAKHVRSIGDAKQQRLATQSSVVVASRRLPCRDDFFHDQE